jgi:hypothetical protein
MTLTTASEKPADCTHPTKRLFSSKARHLSCPYPHPVLVMCLSRFVLNLLKTVVLDITVKGKFLSSLLDSIIRDFFPKHSPNDFLYFVLSTPRKME